MTSTRTLPKSVQLSEMLIREIVAGHLADGARLPTERQMAADLGVAVRTLRKALATLQEKGLLERVQGSGNYVRAKPMVESVYSFFRLELLRGGGLPTAKVLDVLKLAKPEGAPDFGESQTAHRIRRLRYLADKPIAVEEIWLDARFIDRIKKDDLVDSLYLFYKESLDLVISRIEDGVSVDAVPEWTVEEFGMKAGEAAGYIERIGWDQNGDPAEFSKTWFDPKLARFVMRLQ
ncbi:GntR family transcriptional regulator [Hirschia litorea]|uniref:GntR family transcriptional regulator n=1 Tax=Hirschia litorea TaxID=1199156 RepID=A0ABW2IN63_9PROT